MRSLLGRFHRPNARSQSEQLFMLNSLGDGSTLSLDFTTGVLDSRLTFTRSTTGTYINSSGYVTSAAINAPRFDYDPTALTPRGLLIEGSSANVILYSQDFSQATWSKTNATATNPTTAPDGTTSAYLLTSTTAGGVISQTHGPTGNATSTYSIYVKQGTAAYCDMYIYDATAGATRLQVRFTFATKSFTATVGSNPQYQELRDGWFRISATGTTFSTTNNIISYLYVGLAVAGTTYYGWGAQLEPGAGASSYIPTTVSTGSRGADVCYIANVDYGFTTNGGTYLAEWHRGSNITTGSTNNNAFATDYASGRWLGIYTTGAGSTGTAGSWSGYLNSSGAVSGINKMAVSYSSWVASASGNTSLNGGAIVSGTLTLGTTPTYLFIGAASATSPYNGGGFRDPLNNCVRQIKYWPSVLPNAQLQSLTT